VLSAIFILEGRLKSKEQVTKDLAAIDVQVDRAGFFWGRWESSKWGYGAFGGIEYPAVAGGRTWGARNIFVGFDQKRMVTTWTVIDDKKLFHQLDLLEQKGFRPRGQRLW
jgi:hypothetical protein